MSVKGIQPTGALLPELPGWMFSEPMSGEVMVLLLPHWVLTEGQFVNFLLSWAECCPEDPMGGAAVNSYPLMDGGRSRVRYPGWCVGYDTSGTLGPSFLAVRAQAPDSHPPPLSLLGNLARLVWKLTGACPGLCSRLGAPASSPEPGPRAGHLARKPHRTWRGAVAPGRGHGSCSLISALADAKPGQGARESLG